ncbi:MAG: hypothetical protein AUG51_21275 [Acidobacteria bacterium 13_1_20CM_3_53_8]|nr:MAG: hypothetical protein AUG51_21275 [Acidobacteria bacterium 13_1_20CM_3_53_8]
MSRFARCDVSEVAAAKSGDEREGIEEESRRILSGLHADTFAILLDVEGREWSSQELAASDKTRRRALVALAPDADARDGSRTFSRAALQSVHDHSRSAVPEVRDEG